MQTGGAPQRRPFLIQPPLSGSEAAAPWPIIKPLGQQATTATRTTPTRIAKSPSLIKTPPKPVERLPVGWRSNSHSEALYGCKIIFRPFVAPTNTKRQPAGTGRRSTGAFGLIPVGGTDQ